MKDIIALRNLRRGKYHAGYVWAALMNDGEYVCRQCVHQEYAQIYKSTYSKAGNGWQCVGVIGSHEEAEAAHCAHCNKLIWEGMEG